VKAFNNDKFYYIDDYLSDENAPPIRIYCEKK
jgi:hypothetical protein